MSRREITERAILQAVEDQLFETGMSGMGINAVARRAGVSRELIYRYFDGMPGLMMAWMKEQDFWTKRPDPLTSDETDQKTPAELIHAMLHNQIDVLGKNPALCEVRRWELIERNEVSTQLAERRETAAKLFIDRVDGLSEEADIPAIVSIMLAGSLYLMLRAKTEEFFLGIPIRTDEGWERITKSLDFIVNSLPEDLKIQSLKSLEEARNNDASNAGKI